MRDYELRIGTMQMQLKFEVPPKSMQAAIPIVITIIVIVFRIKDWEDYP